MSVRSHTEIKRTMTPINTLRVSTATWLNDNLLRRRRNMWYLRIRVFPKQEEELLLTKTDNTYWLQELIAKLLECENAVEIKLEKGVKK